jgi:hypothetical protein
MPVFVKACEDNVGKGNQELEYKAYRNQYVDQGELDEVEMEGFRQAAHLL